MIIKDQNGNEFDVDEIVFESDNEYLDITVKEGKIHVQVNDELFLHNQLKELYKDDHPQYLDQARHSTIDHSSMYAPPILDDIDDVVISSAMEDQVLTYVNGLWVNKTSNSTKNHTLLSNLDSDDHLQYVHCNNQRIITAKHVFSTGDAPFVISSSSAGHLVSGLNAELLNGKSASQFAAADHTHTYVTVAPHTHPGTDITSAVSIATNALQLGGKTADQFSLVGHTHLGSEITSRVSDSALLEGHNAAYFALATHTHEYAPSNMGVTGGDNHNHDGVTTKKVDHYTLLNIGQKTHTEIDTHLMSVSNPHSVTKSQIGLSDVDNAKQIPISVVTTKGDLVVGTGAGSVARFGLGSNGYLMVVDTTQPTGMRWSSVLAAIGGPYALTTHNHDSVYAPLSHTHSQYSLATHDHDSVYLKLAGGTLTGVLVMGGNRIANVADPTTSSDAATKAYVDARTSGSTVVKAVIAIQNTPPASPATGDRYIIGTAPTDAWALYSKYIAQKTLTGWDFTAPVNGMVCPVTSDNSMYTYDSINGWSKLNLVYDHGALTGLTDDDHPQYAALARNGTITAGWTFNPTVSTNSPFYVGNSVVVANLNANYLQGHDATYFSPATHTHSESNPTITKYLKNDGTWDNPALRFAPLSHSHDTLYYTKTQMATSGSAAIHWNNITNVPSLTPNVHATNHQDGGSDEINVTGLSGLLADGQTPLAHDLLNKHTVSGLTTGYFLKALSATTFGFAAHGLTYSDVGGAAASHTHDTLYSSISHNHDSVYSKLGHTHSNYALTTHNHDSVYAAISHTHSQYALTTHDHASVYAPIAKGVTNGDSHDHNGGDGAQIAHTSLSGIGSNTHAIIDTHLANSAIHRSIDDSSVTTTNLWSASKISTMLSAKLGTTLTYNKTLVGNSSNVAVEATIVNVPSWVAGKVLVSTSTEGTFAFKDYTTVVYSASNSTYTLPSSPAVGDTFEYIGTGSNWTLYAPSGVYIRNLSSLSSPGGNIHSSSAFDCARLRYIGSNVWMVSFANGNLVTA